MLWRWVLESRVRVWLRFNASGGRLRFGFGRLNLILKVDVAGSADAIRSALEVS